VVLDCLFPKPSPLVILIVMVAVGGGVQYRSWRSKTGSATASAERNAH
jgi:hypothetical protein